MNRHKHKAMVFPVVMYTCESWTIKKVEHRKTDGFKLWCWRRLSRVSSTARRSNQSILEEINPEYLLAGLMLKWKLQYFDHLMQRPDSLGKTLMLRKIERRREWQRMRWLDGIIDSMDMSLSKFWEDSEGQESLACCSPWGRKESDTTEGLNNDNLAVCSYSWRQTYFCDVSFLTLARAFPCPYGPLSARRWLCSHGLLRVLALTLKVAKSLQSCPTLCNPIDGSPPGSPIPGILQAKTLEWVAISFSNAWKWKVKVKSLSRVWLFVTPWSAAYQAPPPMGFSRQEYWSGVPLPSPDPQRGDLKAWCHYSATINPQTILSSNTTAMHGENHTLYPSLFNSLVHQLSPCRNTVSLLRPSGHHMEC